ncbi:Bro-N domain-containing protein [Streptomyces sp. PT12]|uniref:BRO-N domain-containing protein n=1 Tax=Streptomyces sp. PT12 TaxID=1510197 RepID=UPI0026B8C187|nr:Bro-N domain-containing protein [Streptomyces sp. PT12]
MSDELQVFAFEGAEVRTVLVDGEPWWVAADVASVLDVGRTHDAVRSLDDDEKGAETIRTLGGEQTVTVINEPGLYSLILRSRKPQARAFKRWVTHEMLPVIRRTGAYAPGRREVSAAAGPLPYREQAEVLAILRPVLPEPYAVATGKIIMARVMGERPELEAAETPLYASTFLAEKGHKPKTVAKFQSPFGRRASDRYLKVHGRRPEKIPGPAGSRIDKVTVYSEDDRPLLEQVYSEMAEVIRAFEDGAQTAIGA